MGSDAEFREAVIEWLEVIERHLALIKTMLLIVFVVWLLGTAVAVVALLASS